MAQHTLEVQSGERFEFGKNWTRFLGSLNEERIVQAVGIPGAFVRL
jgi:hypothetical protein